MQGQRRHLVAQRLPQQAVQGEGRHLVAQRLLQQAVQRLLQQAARRRLAERQAAAAVVSVLLPEGGGHGPRAVRLPALVHASVPLQLSRFLALLQPLAPLHPRLLPRHPLHPRLLPRHPLPHPLLLPRPPHEEPCHDKLDGERRHEVLRP